MNDIEQAIFPCKAEQVAPMTLRMKISDETLDRMGTILSADGWDTRAYQKNPVVLNGHRLDDITEIVAKATHTWTEHGELMQDWLWAVDANPKAAIGFHLYRSGFCRAASARFRPIKWIVGGPRDPFVVKYTEQELTEVSACGVPINPNALARALTNAGAPASLVDACGSIPFRTPPTPGEKGLALQQSSALALLASDIADAVKRIQSLRS